MAGFSRILVCLIALPALLGAAPSVYWRFDDGQAGKTALTLVSEAGPGNPPGPSGRFPQSNRPAFVTDVVGSRIWDGSTFACANPENDTSLNFTAAEVNSEDAVAETAVTVDDAPPLRPSSFTVEAFIKVAAPEPHHMILVSKRRRDFNGCSWSLSIDPKGTLRARFDTQEGQTGRNGVDWNQSVAASATVVDGEWHHVALTYEHELQTASLFVDYVRCGRRNTKRPLVYDDSDLIMGRGMVGLLDEVRLTAAALHPEQFLRPAQFFSDLRPTVQREAVLDETRTRVQTGLTIPWPKIGTLKPGLAEGVGTSMWSLGCETLDRSLADWDAYKGYLKPLGIRRIRLQGGWARTEKKKGEYDFSWLDRVVDDALARGLDVCLETSYGNRLYQPDAGLGPGGLIPQGEETLAAWDHWVEAMAQRYSAKGVKSWMMYNEPNLRQNNTIDKVTDFNIRTAETIKRVDPDAKIAGLVSSGVHMGYIEGFLKALKEQRKTSLFEWLVYHAYSANPDAIYPAVETLQALVGGYAPEMKLWQGEAGCASEEVQYALSGIDWTEFSQAKWNARRMLGDLGHGIQSAVFTISDLSYSKEFISRYGLLKTHSDNSIIKVKVAYYMVQNLVSVFNDALVPAPEYTLSAVCEHELAWYAYRDRKTGLDVIACWDGTGIPGNEFRTHPVDLVAEGAALKEPVWLDLLTGRVHAIPDENVRRQGEQVTLTGVPIYDSPVVITDRSLLRIVPAREKKKKKS